MRLLRLRLLAFALIFFCASMSNSSEPVQAHHARVELVAQQSSIAPSQQVWVGVHFSLEKDWHIYWINPGDSGLPPTLKWQLPAGFSAGAIQWPRPEKLKHSTLADYGYQGDAMLLVPLRVPANVKDGSMAEMGLQAKWLICREVCIADHADLHLALPVGSKAGDTREAALFTEAKKQLPKAWPHSWRASATSDKDNFVLSIRTGKPIQAAEFYPLSPEQIDNAADQPLKTTAQGAKITLKKSDQLLKPIQLLKGLIVLGNGEAYVLQAPVTSAQEKSHNN